MKFSEKSQTVSRIIICITFILTIISLGVLFGVQLGIRNPGEPYSGRAYFQPFNYGWKLIREDGTSKELTLPAVEEIGSDEKIILENVIPGTVQNNMCLFTRTSRQNIRIFVDGNLRTEYITDNLSLFARNVPSSYIFIDLTKSDAFRTVRMELWGSSPFRNQLQEVAIAHASSVWNSIWRKYGLIAFTNLILLICGVVALVICIVFSIVNFKHVDLLYLSYSLILFSIWALCENRLRQIIFKNPTVAGVLVFFIMAMMVIPLYSYWNSVQKKRYTFWYNLVNGSILIINLVITVLYILKKYDFFDFILVNYIFIALGIIVCFVTTFIDLLRHSIWEYRYSALGMVCVSFAGAMELILSRVQPFYAAGGFLSISLVMMLLLSSVQGIRDLIDEARNRERHMGELTLRTIRTVAGTIDAKDEYTGGHSARVAEYAVALARALGKTETECRNIHYIGLMHDIGKISVPDVILNKNGKLVQDEYTLMRLHTTIGCEIIGVIDSVPGLKEGVLYHHEWYNGEGYPVGLKGKEIPEVARILCLADSYDAMTSNRVYRHRLSDKEVRAEIIRCSGTQFDPDLVKVFVKLLDSGKIKPQTADGFDKVFFDETPSVSVSLQKMIQKNNSLAGAYELTNPEFIRMIVYIVKLAERNRQPLIVKLFTVKGKDGSELSEDLELRASEILGEAISSIIKTTDITTPYSRTKRLVLFMNMDLEKSEHAISEIKETFECLDTEHQFMVSAEEISLD